MPYMDDDVRARIAELVEEIETSSFRETKWGRRGYSEREVDDFLDYLVDVLFALLSTPAPVAAPDDGTDLGEAIEPEVEAPEVEAPEVEEPEVEAPEVVEVEAPEPEVEEPEPTVLAAEADADAGAEDGPDAPTEVLGGDSAADGNASGVESPVLTEALDAAVTETATESDSDPGVGEGAADSEGGTPLPPWVAPR